MNSDYYSPATGGMLNIFRLFILRSIRLLKKGGIFSEIFPLAFIGDLSIKKLREFILENTEIISIDAFPERDNPNKRVFEVAKMSVCILNLQNYTSNQPFFIRINNNKFIDVNTEKNYLTRDVIRILDNEGYTFPLTSKLETRILVDVFKIQRDSKKLVSVILVKLI